MITDETKNPKECLILSNTYNIIYSLLLFISSPLQYVNIPYDICILCEEFNKAEL